MNFCYFMQTSYVMAGACSILRRGNPGNAMIALSLLGCQSLAAMMEIQQNSALFSKQNGSSLLFLLLLLLFLLVLLV